MIYSLKSDFPDHEEDIEALRHDKGDNLINLYEMINKNAAVLNEGAAEKKLVNFFKRLQQKRPTGLPQEGARAAPKRLRRNVRNTDAGDTVPLFNTMEGVNAIAEANPEALVDGGVPGLLAEIHQRESMVAIRRIEQQQNALIETYRMENAEAHAKVQAELQALRQAPVGRAAARAAVDDTERGVLVERLETLENQLQDLLARVHGHRDEIQAITARLHVHEGHLSAAADAANLIIDGGGNGVVTDHQRLLDVFNVSRRANTTVNGNKTVAYTCVRHHQINPVTNSPYCDGKTGATKHPLCIMEVEPSMADMTLSDATSLWRGRMFCATCASTLACEMPSLKMVSAPRVKLPTEIVPSELFNSCFGCMSTTANQKDGDVPLCTTCKAAIAKKSDSHGSDDRSDFMRAVNFRFPWISLLPVNWREYCEGLRTTRAEAARAKYKGPDTFMTARVNGRKVIIILEEDGGSCHKSNKPDKEVSRLQAVMTAVVKNREDLVIMIRYSPEGEFENSIRTKYEPSKTVRLLVVRSWIVWYISKVLKRDAKMPTFTVLYLFYQNGNKHIRKAKKVLGAKDKWAIGVSHTNPQDTFKDDEHHNQHDWRYCIHPNEGVLFNILAKDPEKTAMTLKSVRYTFQGLFAEPDPAPDRDDFENEDIDAIPSDDDDEDGDEEDGEEDGDEEEGAQEGAQEGVQEGDDS